MHAWRIRRNPRTEIEEHTVAPGVGHALLAPVVANIFEALRVSAALWEHGLEWKVLHTESTLTGFEFEHGKETERYRYNVRNLEAVVRRARSVRGELTGLSDFFVPVVIRRRVTAVLVVGPFWQSPPASAELLARWQWLTGRQAHPSDPEFASYLSATLSTLVLDESQTHDFQRLLEALALLMAGEGRADRLTNRAEVLGARLKEARFCERTWEVVRQMLDERSSKTWESLGSTAQLRRLGLARLPDAMLVGLCRQRETASDPVDEIVRYHAFQRSSVALAQKLGGLLVGQVGDHGVVFLSSASGSTQARRLELLAVADRAQAMARQKFGLSLHCGACVVPRTALFSRSYEAALSAAQSALADGKKIVMAEPETRSTARSLRDLRRELGQAVERPQLIRARFDRYLEAVGAHCGHRLESARGQLEAGFERVAEPLLASGALDEKSYLNLGEALDRAAGDARTLSELFAAHRRAVADIAEAIEKPTVARRDRSLRRALEYVHRHYTEPVRLEQLARLSGFSADHFSRLFRQREHMSFERYVRSLRIERAQQLLSGTELGVTRIGELAGFGSGAYFCTVFRSSVGVTPLTYRQKSRLTVAGEKPVSQNTKHGKSKRTRAPLSVH